MSFMTTTRALCEATQALHMGRALAQLHTQVGSISAADAKEAAPLLRAMRGNEIIRSSPPLRETLSLLCLVLEERSIDEPTWPPELLAAFGDETLTTLIGEERRAKRIDVLARLHAESPALVLVPIEVVRGLIDEGEGL